jgi:hypothetical protein
MTTTATQLMTAEQFFDWVHRPEKADFFYMPGKKKTA